MPKKTLPNHADLQPYNHAVAGHEGTLCDPDGELFIKPCVQQEIDFYETAFKDHKSFAEWMPAYLGTLVLNDVTDMESLNEQLPAVADHMSLEMKEEALRLARDAAGDAADESAESSTSQDSDNVTWRPNKNKKIPTNKSVVLENAAFGFTRPNILDAKLGRRLWADDAPLEKRHRFDEISKATTNGSHGFRIAGMRVYKGAEDPAELDEEGYKVYDKDYGRLRVDRHNIVDEMRKFIFNAQAGIDEDLGKIIAGAFVEDLKRVEHVLANEESRMYSASLLFTFEGDGEALRAAIEQMTPSQTSSPDDKEKSRDGFSRSPRIDSGMSDMDQVPPTISSKEKNGDGSGLSATRVDSAIVLDDDGEMVLRPSDGGVRHGAVTIGDGGQVVLSPVEEHVKMLGYGAEGDFTSEVYVDEVDMDDDEDEDELSNLPRIYSLKLIDFAHAKWVPGQGPDENNLLGVRSLVKIFEELSR